MRIFKVPFNPAVLIFQFLIFFCIWIRCNTIDVPPERVPALFERWFINLTPSLFDTLSNTGYSCSQWDSLALPLKKTFSGESSVVLTDMNGRQYTLGFMTPPRLRSDTTYPLIIYLHGGVGTMHRNKGEKAYDMLRPLSDSLELFIASPSADRMSPWWSDSGIERILQTVRFMSLYFPVNPDRIFAAGVSDGALGCYALANMANAPFAGFIAISGYGEMLTRFGIPLVYQNLMQRPIYNVNAGKDRLYPLRYVEDFLIRLKSAGVPVVRKIYSEEEHGFDYREREFGSLVYLLRTWSRPADRTGFSWSVIPGYPNRADNLPEIVTVSGDESQPATLNGYWRGDTLVVRTHQIDRFLFETAVAPNGAYVIVNDTPPRFVYPLPDNAVPCLKRMRHHSTISLPPEAVYEITIPIR